MNIVTVEKMWINNHELSFEQDGEWVSKSKTTTIEYDQQTSTLFLFEQIESGNHILISQIPYDANEQVEMFNGRCSIGALLSMNCVTEAIIKAKWRIGSRLKISTTVDDRESESYFNALKDYIIEKSGELK